METTVSVIIPVFNHSRELFSCLHAAENQKLPRSQYEIIVILNGGEWPSHLQNSFPNVRFEMESRRGSYAARNLGIKIARGALLAFTDADCTPHSDWLLNGMTKSFEIGAGKVDYALPRKLFEFYDSAWMKIDQKKFIEQYYFASTANLFVKKDVMQKIGPFNPTLFSGGDVEWGKRAFKNNFQINYLDDAIVYHPLRKSFKEMALRERRLVGGFYSLKKQNIHMNPNSLLGFIQLLTSPFHFFRFNSLEGKKVSLYFCYVAMRWLRIIEWLRLSFGGTPYR